MVPNTLKDMDKINGKNSVTSTSTKGPVKSVISKE